MYFVCLLLIWHNCAHLWHVFPAVELLLTGHMHVAEWPWTPGTPLHWPALGHSSESSSFTTLPLASSSPAFQRVLFSSIPSVSRSPLRSTSALPCFQARLRHQLRAVLALRHSPSSLQQDPAQVPQCLHAPERAPPSWRTHHLAGALSCPVAVGWLRGPPGCPGGYLLHWGNTSCEVWPGVLARVSWGRQFWPTLDLPAVSLNGAAACGGVWSHGQCWNTRAISKDNLYEKKACSVQGLCVIVKSGKWNRNIWQ